MIITALQRCSQFFLQSQPTGTQDTLCVSFTPLQRCSRCILQSQPTGTQDTLWVSFTSLQRCNWCILQPRRLRHRTLFRWVLLLSIDAVGVFCTPSQLEYRRLVGGVLFICKDAVGVFCSPSWLIETTYICKEIIFRIVILLPASFPYQFSMVSFCCWVASSPSQLYYIDWLITKSNRWSTLRPAVVSTARIWCVRSLDIPRASGGRHPSFNPLRRG